MIVNHLINLTKRNMVIAKKKVKKKAKKTQKKIVPVIPEKRGFKNPILFKQFIQYMATPEPLREEEYGYRTITAFSENNKINRRTLTKWKHDPDYNKQRQILMKEWGKDRTPAVIQSLYRTILREGKASEAKLWLQYIEEWEPGIILKTPEMVSAIKERTELLRQLIAQEKLKTKKI